MTDPRLPRGAFARLALVFALALGVTLALSFSARAGSLPATAGDPAAVLAAAERFVGAGKVTSLPGPWCADFASLVLRLAGRRPLPNRMASSALAYGPLELHPRPGDLIVLRHGSHVGIFAGWERGLPVMVSGNWGHRVRRAVISRGLVAAFVRV